MAGPCGATWRRACSLRPDGVARAVDVLLRAPEARALLRLRARRRRSPPPCCATAANCAARPSAAIEAAHAGLAVHAAVRARRGTPQLRRGLMLDRTIDGGHRGRSGRRVNRTHPRRGRARLRRREHRARTRSPPTRDTWSSSCPRQTRSKRSSAPSSVKLRKTPVDLKKYRAETLYGVGGSTRAAAKLYAQMTGESCRPKPSRPSTSMHCSTFWRTTRRNSPTLQRGPFPSASTPVGARLRHPRHAHAKARCPQAGNMQARRARRLSHRAHVGQCALLEGKGSVTLSAHRSTARYHEGQCQERVIMHIKEALCMANDNPTSSDQVIPGSRQPCTLSAEPRAVMARLQRARTRTGRRRVGPSSAASELHLHLLEQPAGILHGARRQPDRLVAREEVTSSIPKSNMTPAPSNFDAIYAALPRALPLPTNAPIEQVCACC